MDAEQKIQLIAVGVFLGLLISIYLALTDLNLYEHAQAMRYPLLLALTVIGLLFGLAYYALNLRLIQTRRAQQRSERLYRAFVEQTTEGVVLAEAGTLRLIDANAAAARLLGLARQGSVRLTLPEVIQLEPARLAEALADIQPGEQRDLGEVGQRLPGGELLQLELTASIISHEERSILSLMVRDVGERRRVEEVIRFHAFHDALTRLPNRLLFEDRLKIALAQARRAGETSAILFLDLDQLKEVNDRFGHETGDALLIEVGRRLLANVRAGDTVARVGGDEFLVLLPTISYPEDTIALCDRLLQALRAPMQLLGHDVSASASMGVALFPVDGTEVRELVHKADLAMYLAKERGKDNWQLYSSELRDHLQQLADTRSNFRKKQKKFKLLRRAKGHRAVPDGHPLPT